MTTSSPEQQMFELSRLRSRLIRIALILSAGVGLNGAPYLYVVAVAGIAGVVNGIFVWKWRSIGHSRADNLISIVSYAVLYLMFCSIVYGAGHFVQRLG